MAAILPSCREVSYCTSRFFRGPAKQFVKRDLPFPRGLKTHTHIGYHAVNHAENDNVHRSRQIIAPNPKVQ